MNATSTSVGLSDYIAASKPNPQFKKLSRQVRAFIYSLRWSSISFSGSRLTGSNFKGSSSDWRMRSAYGKKLKNWETQITPTNGQSSTQNYLRVSSVGICQWWRRHWTKNTALWIYSKKGFILITIGRRRDQTYYSVHVQMHALVLQR